MGLDIPAGTPDRGPGLKALASFLLVVTTLMTLIRLISKVVTKQRWWWDDLFALLSWPAQTILLSLVIVWIHVGLGLHTEFVVAQDISYLIKGLTYSYVGTLFFNASVCLPKLSALFFYARVFNTRNRSLRIQLWIIVPSYEQSLGCLYPGECINTFAWYIATSATSFVIDIWILIIPIPLIWGLNSSLRRRIYLLIAFFLTYSVIVISIGRLITITHVVKTAAEDELWRMVTYLYWVILEGSLSIISISVPNAIALAKHLLSRTQTTKNNIGKSLKFTCGYEVNPSQNYTSIHRGKRSSGENSDQQELFTADNEDAEMALRRIKVKTDIRVH